MQVKRSQALYKNATEETKGAFDFFLMLTPKTRTAVLEGRDNILIIQSEELKTLCTTFIQEVEEFKKIREQICTTHGFSTKEFNRLYAQSMLNKL